MRTTVLLAEFLVIGILGGTSVLFGVLALTGHPQFPALERLEAFLVPSLALLALVAYLIGAVSYRLTEAISFVHIPMLRKLRLLSRAFPRVAERTESEWYEDYFLIWQFGSDNLIRRIELGDSLFRLFKAATVWLALLSFTGFWWLRLALPIQHALGLAFIMLSFSGASFGAFAFQRFHNYKTLIWAAEVIRRYVVEKESPGTRPDDLV